MEELAATMSQSQIFSYLLCMANGAQITTRRLTSANIWLEMAEQCSYSYTAIQPGCSGWLLG